MPLFRLAAMLLASSLVLTHASFAATRVLTIVTQGNRDPARTFANELTRLTEGRIAVDIRSAVAIGSEGDYLAAVRTGSIDLSFITGTLISGIVPRYGVFDVPFLFRDEAHARAVLNGPVIAELSDAFRPAGLTLLGVGDQGFRDITNNKRPIARPADMKGLRMRVISSEVFKLAFEQLGSVVVPVDFARLPQALQDGRVDGQENPPANIVSSGLQEVQRYMTPTHHVFSTVAIVMNAETYASLDEADREAVTQAVAAARRTFSELADRDNDAGLARLRQAGLEIATGFDRAAFVTALAPLEPEFERRFGRELLRQIRTVR